MKTLPIHLILVARRLATCALASLLATTAFGQAATHADTSSTTPTASSRPSGELKHADRRFIEKAAQSGREEVDIARAVVDHSTNADVKKFAQMMIDDHGQANEQLQSLASARGVTLKEDKDKLGEKWARKDPKDIDRDYAKKMVADHKKDIDLFSRESKDGGDPELVDFARKTLPTLQHHLEEANRLESQFR